MRIHQVENAVMAAWRAYPIRVVSRQLSRCCQSSRLLVRNELAEGWIDAICAVCGKNEFLRHAEFEELDLWVQCPICQNRAEPGRQEFYGFYCAECGVFLRLADLLPQGTGAPPS